MKEIAIITISAKPVSTLRYLFDTLSSWSPRFAPRAGLIRFVLDRNLVEQGILPVLSSVNYHHTNVP